MKLLKQYFLMGILLIVPTIPVKSNSTFKQINDSVPLDKSIKHGRLANGFTYYIKPLATTGSNVKMHFYVKTGVDYEKQNEVDFAHAIEHLAFRETKNFPKGLILENERLADLNLSKTNFSGYTAKTETLYTFDTPESSREALYLGLLWFQEIAAGLEISDYTVNRERGVLRQEFYKIDSNKEETLAQASLYSKLFPCKKGLEHFYEINESFSSKSLEDFYIKWYRPDLMAISVVGDVENVDQLEDMISSIFSTLKLPGEPIVQPTCDLTYFNSPPGFALVEKDRDTLKTYEDKSSSVYLFYRDPITEQDLKSWSGIDKKISGIMLSNILTDRLEYAINRNSPFYTAQNTHTYKLSSSPSALKVEIRAENNYEKEAVQDVIYILNQLKKNGVTTEEFLQAKKKTLTALKALDTTSSNYWLNQISEHFLRGEALSTNKLSSTEALLENLTLKHFNNRVKQILANLPQDIGVIISKGFSKPGISEKALHKWIREVSKKPILSYEVPQIPDKILEQESLNLLKEKDLYRQPETIEGVEEYILDNGVKIILKESNPSPSPGSDIIMLHGFSSKGAACFPQTDHFSAINGPGIIQNTGIGSFTPLQLNSFLKATNSLQRGVTPYVEYKESGIKGSSSSMEFEQLLQIVYLYFTDTRKNKSSFEEWKAQAFQESNYLFENPSIDFPNAVEKIVDDHFLPLRGTMWSKGLKETDFEKSHEIYDLLFGRADDYTFIITGKFEKTIILSQINKYLGNLPNLSVLDFCMQTEGNKTSLPKSGRHNIISSHLSPGRSIYGLKFLYPREKDILWNEEINVILLGQILNLKLEKLRYEDGLALYRMGAVGTANLKENRYEVNLRIECDAKDFLSIEKRIKAYLKEIRDGQIENDVFARGTIQLKSLYNVQNLERSGQIQKRLYNHYKYGDRFIDSSILERYVESIKVEDVIATAAKILKEEHLYEFLMQKEFQSEK